LWTRRETVEAFGVRVVPDREVFRRFGKLPPQ
jgi:hypothetical protein